MWTVFVNKMNFFTRGFAWIIPVIRWWFSLCKLFCSMMAMGHVNYFDFFQRWSIIIPVKKILFPLVHQKFRVNNLRTKIKLNDVKHSIATSNTLLVCFVPMEWMYSLLIFPLFANWIHLSWQQKTRLFNSNAILVTVTLVGSIFKRSFERQKYIRGKVLSSTQFITIIRKRAEWTKNTLAALECMRTFLHEIKRTDGIYIHQMWKHIKSVHLSPLVFLCVSNYSYSSSVAPWQLNVVYVPCNECMNEWMNEMRVKSQ